MAKVTQALDGGTGFTARTNFNTAMRTVEVSGGITGTGEAGNPVSAQTALDGKVNNSRVLTDVPSPALFTDTIYDDSLTLVDSDAVTAVTPSNKLITQADANIGDMQKITYDLDNTGVVDDSELVNGLSVQTAVPVGAVFTDTDNDTTDHTALTNVGTITHADIDTHINNLSNPHEVLASQLSLGNVDNTSDANKPVSTATQTALDGKVDDSQVLTNVPSGAVFTDDDTTDHTAFSNIGTNTHAQIDTHLASTSNPHTVTAAQANAVGNDDTESGASSVVNCVFITQANYDLLTPVSTTLYIING